MPKIPVLNDRSVRPQGIPVAGVPTPDVSSGALSVARGLGQAASVADHIARVERDKLDAARILEAETTLETWTTDQFSALNEMQGEEAISKSAEFMDAWNARVDEIGRNLSTPRQLEAFRRRALERSVSVDRRVTQFGADRAAAYRASAYRGRLETHTTTALEVVGDPEAFEGEIGRALDTIEMAGLDADKAAEEIQADKDRWRSTVIRQAVAQMTGDGGDPARARAIFDAHEQDLKGADRAAARNALRESEERAWVLAEADKVTEGVERWGVDAADRARAAVEGVDDLDRRAALGRELDLRRRMIEDRWSLHVDEKFNEAALYIERGGSTSRIDRDTWANVLDSQRRAALVALERARDGRESVRTDLGRLYRDWYTKSDAEKAGIPLLTFAEFVAPNDLEQLMKEQGRIRKALDSGDGAPPPSEIGWQKMLRIALDTGDLDLEDDELGKVTLAVGREVAAAEALGDRKLSQDEIQQVVDRTLTQEIVERKPWLWFNSTDPAALDGQAAVAGLYQPYESIRPEVRSVARDVLRSANLPSDSEAVATFVGRYHAGRLTPAETAAFQAGLGRRNQASIDEAALGDTPDAADDGGRLVVTGKLRDLVVRSLEREGIARTEENITAMARDFAVFAPTNGETAEPGDAAGKPGSPDEPEIGVSDEMLIRKRLGVPSRYEISKNPDVFPGWEFEDGAIVATDPGPKPSVWEYSQDPLAWPTWEWAVGEIRRRRF